MGILTAQYECPWRNTQDRSKLTVKTASRPGECLSVDQQSTVPGLVAQMKKIPLPSRYYGVLLLEYQKIGGTIWTHCQSRTSHVPVWLLWLLWLLASLARHDVHDSFVTDSHKRKHAHHSNQDSQTNRPPCTVITSTGITVKVTAGAGAAVGPEVVVIVEGWESDSDIVEATRGRPVREGKKVWVV